MKTYLIDTTTNRCYEQVELMCGDSRNMFRATLVAVADWYGENSEYVIPCSNLQNLLFKAIQRIASNENKEIGTVMRTLSERIGNVNIFDAIKNMYDKGEIVVFAVNPASALRIAQRDLKGE